MQKIKSLVVLLFLTVFFLKAVIFIAEEIKHDYGIFQKFYGLNDDRKRKLLLGDIYGLIHYCILNIPAQANVLILTDNSNEALVLNYHLYPRKLFYDNFDPVRHVPPPIIDLDFYWLKSKKIEWVIFRFTNKCNHNRIVKIVDGKVLQVINPDNATTVDGNDPQHEEI